MSAKPRYDGGENWSASHPDLVPGPAYDRMRGQLHTAERLLAEIRNGKHSLPGALVQIDRYFEARGKSVNDAMRRQSMLGGRIVGSETLADGCVCESCGHIQAEPNWCHECGHRTTWPEWAKKREAEVEQLRATMVCCAEKLRVWGNDEPLAVADVLECAALNREDGSCADHH